MASATFLGGALAALARTRATLVAQSPCSGRRGRSSSRLTDGAQVEVEGPGRDRALQRGPEQLGQVPLDREDSGGHDTPGVAAPRSCWAMIPATRCRS